MPTSIDIQAACQWLVDEIAPQLITDIKDLKTTDLKVEHKGKNDLLTKIDTHVDNFLINALRHRYPESNFLTEETVDAAATQAKNFAAFSSLPNLWIIDPIDGTANLAAGSRDYAISVALVEQGEVVLGVVIVPEADQIFYANTISGQALLKVGDTTRKLQVSSVKKLDEAKMCLELTGRPALRVETQPLVQKLIPHLGDMRAYGSAVLSFVRVATGEIDAYQCPAYPWDMAAGSLILRQAGGQITLLNGEAWTPFSPNALLSNGYLHAEILNILNR